MTDPVTIRVEIPVRPMGYRKMKVAMRDRGGRPLKRPRLYMEKEYKVYQQIIKNEVEVDIRDALNFLDGHARRAFYFNWQIPKARFLFRVKDQKKWGTERQCKPDIDNLEKPILDALTGVLWSDDCKSTGIPNRRRMYAKDDGVILWIEGRMK